MRLFLFIILVYMCWILFGSVSADFFIYRALPNTTDDKNLEYIELLNTSSSTGSLLWYRLWDASGKTYTIGEVEIWPKQTYQFLRPDTKIILNNSNEEIFLHTPEWQEADTVSYKSSTKWQVIEFFEFTEKIISDESVLYQWYSDEADPEPITWENKQTLPEIQIDFQQPTYLLETDEEKSEYTCDSSRDSCKVNFDFSRSFWTDFSAWDYKCETSFWFISWQENRCNPNTIEFPKWVFEVSIKIVSQSESSDSTHKTILIRNPVDEWQDTSEQTSEQESDTEDEWSDTDSWEDTTSSHTKQSWDISVPEIQVDFQQPTYLLETDEEKWEYICDSSKDSCKVNFDFSRSFWTDFSAWDYRCETSFWFVSWQENRCNPNTIEFPKWSFEISVKILSQSDSSVYKEKTFTLTHTHENTLLSDSSLQQETDKQDTSQDTELKTPEVIVWFQVPNYTYFTSDWVYTCDASKEFCKVNFDLRPSFSDDFPVRDYMCEIDVSWQTETIASCNPGTIQLPVWDSTVRFRILHEDDSSIYSETILSFYNGWYNPDIQKTTSLPDQFLHLRSPKIEIQSGLQENGRKYICYGDTCKVNLEYKKRDTLERCVWNFGSGKYTSESTPRRCNPWYVEYTPWRHAITLRIYQKWNTTNYRESRIAFDVVEQDIVPKTEPESLQEITEIQEIELVQEAESFDTQIVLQWRIWNNKTLTWNTLVCESKESCSVNFTSQGDSSPWLRYLWDFWDGTISERENPLSKKYPLWEYTVSLHVFSGEQEVSSQEFFISVVAPEKKTLKKTDKTEAKNETSHVFSGALEISSILVNPVWTDKREWIEIHNTWNDSYIDGCFLKRGTKKYSFPQDTFMTSGEKKKIFRVFSNISLPNKSGTLEILCDWEQEDSIIWNTKIPEWGILLKNGTIARKNYSIRRDDFWTDEEYQVFIQKSFHQNTRVLKSGIKISGQTLARRDINILSSQWHELRVETDADGLFEILLDRGVSSWEIVFDFEFTDELSNAYVFTSKQLFITESDRINFAKKYIPKKKKTRWSTSVIKTLVIEPPQKIDNQTIEELSDRDKALYTLGLIILGFLWALYLLYRDIALQYIEPSHIVTTCFSTKYRVITLVS